MVKGNIKVVVTAEGGALEGRVAMTKVVYRVATTQVGQGRGGITMIGGEG